MLREINEQPSTLAATLDRYVGPESFRTDTCAPVRAWLRSLDKKIVIAASGSSRHASLVAESMIEQLSEIAVDVEYASEFCYRSERVPKYSAVVVVSQSGETADTLAALRKANAAGRPTLAITNLSTSTMAREATVSFPIQAGSEQAIPATKSFTSQLLNLYLLSLLGAEARATIDSAGLSERLAECRRLPSQVAAQLPGWEESVRSIASFYDKAKNFLFLGRGVHLPIAREGALKLKESAYLQAEGYASGELKHGPNALVAEGTPLVMIATVDRTDADSVQRYGKSLKLMRDMRRQGAEILAVANAGDRDIARLATQVIEVAEIAENLLPICEVIPLQLFAYFMAVNNGIDVDRPRHLSKAVLTE